MRFSYFVCVMQQHSCWISSTQNSSPRKSSGHLQIQLWSESDESFNQWTEWNNTALLKVTFCQHRTTDHPGSLPGNCWKRSSCVLQMSSWPIDPTSHVEYKFTDEQWYHLLSDNLLENIIAVCFILLLKCGSPLWSLFVNLWMETSLSIA